MKKIIAAGLLLAFLLVLTACTADEAKQNSAASVSSAAQSEPESSLPDDGSSAVTGAKPPSFARDADTAAAAYTQQTADNTEGAVITFFGDGTFEFRPVFYDGSPSVTGTYETTDSAYVLTVQETTAQNISVEDLGEIRFQFDGDNLIYQGATIGETSDGAVFAP